MEQDEHHFVFTLGGRRFGLPASRVEEVIEGAAVTPVPGAPAALRGLLNHRGRIVACTDLRGLPELHEAGPPPGGGPRVGIVATTARGSVCVEADGVEGVLDAVEAGRAGPLLPLDLEGAGEAAGIFVETSRGS